MENIEKTSPPQEKSGKTIFCLIGIILLAATLVVLQRFMEPEMGRDSSYYLVAAQYWQKGGFQGALEYFNGNFWFPPLHLFLIVLLSKTGLSAENAAMVIGMGCAVLMPLPAFAIARELFQDRRIALAAALLAAVNPTIIDMAVQTQRDVPYLFTIGWTIYLLIAAIRRNNWYWWCAAGFPFAASFLLRYETAEFLPLLGIYFIVALWKKQISWIKLCRNLMIFAASSFAFLVVLLYCTGSLNYMAGSYCRYFLKQTEAVRGLYNGGARK